MSIKWHLEGWVKAYRTKTSGWLCLPVSARGLGRELLTYADEDTGAIPIGDGPTGLEVAYLLGARPKEHKRIVEDVALLVKDQYLIVEPGRIVIRNFVQAQDRTPGAKRTAAWREKKTAEHEARKRGGASQESSAETSPTSTSNVTDRVTETVTSDSTERSPETSHVTDRVTETYARVESSREERDLRSENSVLLFPPGEPSKPQPHTSNDVFHDSLDGVSPDQVKLLAELRSHPILEPIATLKFASVLAGRLMSSGKALAWVLAAIGDAAADATEAGLRPEALAKKVRSYCDNARKPREINQETAEPPTARDELPARYRNQPAKPEQPATLESLREAAAAMRAQGLDPHPAMLATIRKLESESAA